MRSLVMGAYMTFDIRAGVSKWLAYATLLVPCFSFSQVNESDPPQFIVVGIEAAGKDVTSTAGVGADFRPTSRSDVSDDLSKGPSPATVDTVQIEFIIDREGGVQLPRIVSATNMDLAWSVATVLPR